MRTTFDRLLAPLVLLLLFTTSGVGSPLRNTPIVRAVKRAKPAVVNIRGEKTITDDGLQAGHGQFGRRVNGMGTGVVIDPRGYIITNHHVVDGVQPIRVTLDDGRTLIGKLIARDTETDLAVIKVDPPDDMQVITIGASSDLMPGEPVVAVGNAYGYEHTATRGIISAVHRSVQVNDAQYYDDLIQTDASINPGNSGGPLLNIDGEMIGINVAVRAGAQGIGFAIPTNKVMKVVARLLASSTACNTWHGVALSAKAGACDEGLAVVAVERNSPAAAVGLKPGDMITSVDDIRTRRNLDFHLAMLQRKAGEKIEIAVRRADNPLTVQLTLAAAVKKRNEPTHPAWTLLGMKLKPIPADEFHKKHHTKYRGGLTVKAVRPGSPAADQGIRSGDVLVGMHIWETVSLDNVSYIISRPDFAAISPLKFFILRDKETLYGYLPVTVKTAQR